MNNVINFDLFRLRRNTIEAVAAIDSGNYAIAILLLSENLTIIERLKNEY